MTASVADIVYRRPTLADGQRLWELVRAVGTLDQNSCYLYMLLCDQFADTCVIAEMDGQLVGFVTAYRRPDQGKSLFIWQVGVMPAARGRGVAKGLLHRLLKRESCRGLQWIESTVSPSNQASRGLFSAFAKALNVPLHELPYMGVEHFPDEQGHEAEPLLRLGPLPEGGVAIGQGT
jgi:L-2,4-diaminobutyric acid acetyltransferase